MSFKVRGKKSVPEFETPKTSIISEGDKLIKDLIDRQLNKKIQLHEELSRTTHFDKPTELINETETLFGENSLNEFKKHSEHLQQIHELKCAGLTDTEINLYLEYNQNGKEYVLNKHKNLCSSIFTEQLKCIMDKLQMKKDGKLKEANNKFISRHLKELGLSTKPESLETTLFKFATSCSSEDVEDMTPPTHPINKLAEIEKNLFKHLDNAQIPSLKKRRKQAKKYLDSNHDIHSQVMSPKLKTNWDIQKIPESLVGNIEKHPKLYTCTSNRKYTIINNEIVEMKNLQTFENSKEVKLKGQTFISGNVNNEHYQIGEKLSEEEIKKITKFQNYEKGIPSNVILYIQNVAKQTDEKDLINLFNRFDNGSNKITYRLLTGKMRGQAFVTLNNTKQATLALESLNGIVLKNKPLIIQYGKTNTVSTN